LALAWGCQTVVAQEVTTSEPQKLSSKTPNLRILGKNNEGIIIYKFGRGTDIIEAYNSNLMLKWSQNLSIKQDNSSIQEIYLYPEYSVAFFKVQDKDRTVVNAQKLTSKFKGDGSFITMDTLFYLKPEIDSRMKIIHSQDKSHIAMYFPIMTSYGFSDRVRVVGLNMGEENGMEVIYRQEVTFPGLKEGYGLVSVKAANNNQLLFLFENYNRGKKKFADEAEYLVYQYDGLTGFVTPVNFNFSSPIYGLLRMEMDNQNGQLTVAGFYTDEDRNEALPSNTNLSPPVCCGK